MLDRVARMDFLWQGNSLFIRSLLDWLQQSRHNKESGYLYGFDLRRWLPQNVGHGWSNYSFRLFSGFNSATTVGWLPRKTHDGNSLLIWLNLCDVSLSCCDGNLPIILDAVLSMLYCWFSINPSGGCDYCICNWTNYTRDDVFLRLHKFFRWGAYIYTCGSLLLTLQRLCSFLPCYHSLSGRVSNRICFFCQRKPSLFV